MLQLHKSGSGQLIDDKACFYDNEQVFWGSKIKEKRVKYLNLSDCSDTASLYPKSKTASQNDTGSRDGFATFSTKNIEIS